MKALRRHKDWLMIVIAILAIPFVFYFVQRPDYGAIGRGVIGQIYDRKLTQIELNANANIGALAQALGMTQFWQTLSLGQPGNSGFTEFAIKLIVLRHEAERLGLRPDASEIADVVRKLPAFQGDSGGFDINKFNDFVRNRLGPLGLGEEHIEQVARDELCLNEIKRLLAAGISISKTQLDEDFQRGYDKFYVDVIRLHSSDFDKDIKVNDEDVQKYYDAHKTDLKTDEKRKVEFVDLGLSDDQKKLTGKDRIEVLQKLADRATDFTQALLEKGADFKKAADKFKLPVHETGEFTAAAPDPQLKANAQLSAAAFKLSAQEPNSDPVQVSDGFYILHLVGITEARPLSLEEAKPKIVETLKKSRDRELTSTKGAELVQQLREATKSGQSLEAAIQKAGVKPEKLPPFSLFQEETTKPQDNETDQGKELKSEQPSESKEPNNEPSSQANEHKNAQPVAGEQPKSESPPRDKQVKNEPRSKGSKEAKKKPASEGLESKKGPPSHGTEPTNAPASQSKEPTNEPPPPGTQPATEPADLASIKEAVAFLKPGQVSDFSPSGDGGFIAILEKREPFTGTDAGEKKAAFEKRLLDNKERVVFYEWLHDRQQAAGLQFSKS